MRPAGGTTPRSPSTSIRPALATEITDFLTRAAGPVGRSAPTGPPCPPTRGRRLRENQSRNWANLPPVHDAGHHRRPGPLFCRRQVHAEAEARVAEAVDKGAEDVVEGLGEALVGEAVSVHDDLRVLDRGERGEGGCAVPEPVQQAQVLGRLPHVLKVVGPVLRPVPLRPVEQRRARQGPLQGEELDLEGAAALVPPWPGLPAYLRGRGTAKPRRVGGSSRPGKSGKGPPAPPPRTTAH